MMGRVLRCIHIITFTFIPEYHKLRHVQLVPIHFNRKTESLKILHVQTIVLTLNIGTPVLITTLVLTFEYIYLT